MEEKEKQSLITEILQVCKVSNISDDKQIPVDVVFMNLICCSLSELKKIAHELYIKTE